jgi:hypothetical protein
MALSSSTQQREMIQLALAELDISPYDATELSAAEVFWHDHQRWLQDCGYMLRPRYMPDWKPSWPDEAHMMDYEDAQPLLVRLVDATLSSYNVTDPSSEHVS